MALRLLHFAKTAPAFYREYVVLTTRTEPDEDYGEEGYEMTVYDLGSVGKWPTDLPLDRPLSE